MLFYLIMKEFKSTELTIKELDSGIQIFAKAMNFPIDVELSISNTAKLF